MSLNLVHSGFQNLDNTPFAVLSRISNTLDVIDTCGNRFEDSIYQISLYDDRFLNLQNNKKEIKNLLNNKSLNVSRRRFHSMRFEDSNFEEIETGRYKCDLRYSVHATKESGWIESLTEGDNLFQAIWNRFNSSDGYILSDKVNGQFSITSKVNQSWKRPWLFIPNFREINSDRTTCDEITDIDFSITCQGIGIEIVDNVIEAIDNLYSRCKLLIGDTTFVSLLWQGTTLFEIEPEIWQGSVNYRLQVQDNI